MNSQNHAVFVRRLGEREAQRKPAVQTLGTPSRTLTSDSIFGGDREVGIAHHGALYRLKITRQGKLILNK